MGRTLLACALLLGGFGAVIGRLTAGFEHWTFEALRRADAANGAMHFPAMDLLDQAGRPLRLPAGGHGRALLVDFVYTRCESVCQALGTEFYQAQQQVLQQGSGVRLLSVSIDPARDTPAALATYGARHHADTQVWTLAVPRSATDGQRARRQLGIIAVDDGAGGFVHNGALHVIDPRGRVAGIFDTADWPRALALATRLNGAQP